MKDRLSGTGTRVACEPSRERLPAGKRRPAPGAGNFHSESDEDRDRRTELRSFLIECRARINPVELGLPSTPRRRVQGLRRGEVAELVEVSVDWYRALESGRPVRVSPQFVSRLASALRLGPAQTMTLFRLSFPEIYRLGAVFCYSSLGTSAATTRVVPRSALKCYLCENGCAVLSLPRHYPRASRRCRRRGHADCDSARRRSALAPKVEGDAFCEYATTMT